MMKWREGHAFCDGTGKNWSYQSFAELEKKIQCDMAVQPFMALVKKPLIHSFSYSVEQEQESRGSLMNFAG
jgi:hypothetical protein